MEPGTGLLAWATVAAAGLGAGLTALLSRLLDRSRPRIEVMSIALRRPSRQAKTAIKVPEEAWTLARHSRAIDDMPGVLSASQLASFIDEHADRLSKYEAL